MRARKRWCAVGAVPPSHPRLGLACARVRAKASEFELTRHRLDPTEIQLLLDAHGRAVAKQEEKRQAAEKEAEEEREWRERLRRLKRNAPLPRGGR